MNIVREDMLHCYTERLLVGQKTKKKQASKLMVSCLAKEGPEISTHLPTLIVKIKGNGQKERQSEL